MSLPPRERELKLCQKSPTKAGRLSLPPRERELKLRRLALGTDNRGSLPPRERELKPRQWLVLWLFPGRSPRGSVN